MFRHYEPLRLAESATLNVYVGPRWTPARAEKLIRREARRIGVNTKGDGGR